MSGKAGEETEGSGLFEEKEETVVATTADSVGGEEGPDGDSLPSLVVVKTEPESVESTAGSDHGGDETSQSDNPPAQSATLPPRYVIQLSFSFPCTRLQCLRKNVIMTENDHRSLVEIKATHILLQWCGFHWVPQARYIYSLLQGEHISY